MPASVSSLSAIDSAMPVRVAGNAIAGEARPVLFFERGRDFGGLRRRAARSTCPSSPAARGTRRPSPSADRTCSARAARLASSASPPIDSAIRARESSRRARSCRAPSRASPGTSRVFSVARRASSRCLRSLSQKNAASARRGRTTRSLPSRTLSGSRLSMLATVMKSLHQLALRIAHREIALVILHGRDQHFLRQRAGTAPRSARRAAPAIRPAP